MTHSLPKPGSDLYYSWLFLEKPKKNAIATLHTFCHTLTRLLQLTEKDIFQIKWAWWQQELHHTFEGKATHPDAIAVQEVIQTYKIPQTLFIDYLDGIYQRYSLDHCCTEEDFKAFSYKDQGLYQSLAAYIYGFQDPQVLHYTRAIGLALNWMDEILQIGRNLKQDRVFLPLSFLSAWQETSSNAEKEVLLDQEAKKALKAYETALTLLPPPETLSQCPSLIEAKLKSQQLLLSEGYFIDLLINHHELTPLRKYLSSWRYWRRLQKA